MTTKHSTQRMSTSGVAARGIPVTRAGIVSPGGGGTPEARTRPHPVIPATLRAGNESAVSPGSVAGSIAEPMS